MTIKFASPKAKAEMNKVLAQGMTMAKGAATPAKKVRAFTKAAAKAEAANAKWERPNLNALCRKLAGTDMAAGLLLFHILYVWGNRRSKLTRNVPGWPCNEWLAHSRDAWASAAGLSQAEMKDRAVPRLKKYCGSFLMVRPFGIGADKKLWISVDLMAFREAVSASEPWDMYEAALNGIGVGFHKLPANAYNSGLK